MSPLELAVWTLAAASLAMGALTTRSLEICQARETVSCILIGNTIGQYSNGEWAHRLEPRAGGDKRKASIVLGKGTVKSATGKPPTSGSEAGSERSSPSGSPRSPGSPPYGTPARLPRPISQKAYKAAANTVRTGPGTTTQRESGYIADAEKMEPKKSSPEHPTSAAERNLQPPKKPRVWHRASWSVKPGMKKTRAWPNWARFGR